MLSEWTEFQDGYPGWWTIVWIVAGFYLIWLAGQYRGWMEWVFGGFGYAEMIFAMQSFGKWWKRRQ